MWGLNMPNQYSDNFEMNIAKKYGKSACEVLHEFCDKGVSYAEVSELTGYKIWTVKRWCRRYGISLAPVQVNESVSFECEILNKIHENGLNKYNVFSKPWVNYH